MANIRMFYSLAFSPSIRTGTSMCWFGILLLRRCMSSHPTNRDLSDKKYWEQFYKSKKSDNTFEWFVEFNDVREVIQPYLQRMSRNPYIRILELGCGTSDLSLQIFRHLQGKCHIECIDFSHEAVRIMNSRTSQMKITEGELFHEDKFRGINFDVGNALSLPFGKESFDIITDKGTADAVLRSKNGENDFIQVITQAHSVLCQGGTILQFSDEPPETRLDLLERAAREIASSSSVPMKIRFTQIGTSFGVEHFMYSMEKKAC